MGFFTKTKSVDVKGKSQAVSVAPLKSIPKPTGSYLYQPLSSKESIRLFVLAPGNPRDPISGTFTTSKLRSKSEKYEALSYVWGATHSLTNHATIDGHIFPIGGNLFNGLQYFRHPTKQRILWIDALCINQTDEAEKTAQLALMHEVYIHAANVIIWLGLPTASSAVGMDVFRYLAGNGELMGPTTPWRRSTPRVIKAGLNELMSSEYWQRVWVIQEFVLASKITMQSGPHTLSWTSGHEVDCFLTRIKFAEVSPDWKAAGLHECDLRELVAVLEEQLHRTKPRVNEMSLLELVYKNRKRSGPDPRDGVLAVVPVAPPRSRKAMESVDYSMSVEEVYRKLLDVVKRENPEIMGRH